METCHLVIFFPLHFNWYMSVAHTWLIIQFQGCNALTINIFLYPGNIMCMGSLYIKIYLQPMKIIILLLRKIFPSLLDLLEHFYSKEINYNYVVKGDWFFKFIHIIYEYVLFPLSYYFPNIIYINSMMNRLFSIIEDNHISQCTEITILFKIVIAFSKLSCLIQY